MNIGNIVTGVFLKFGTNGLATYQRLSSATQGYNTQLARSQGLLTKNQAALARYQRQMEAITARKLQLVTNVATGVAVVGAAAIADAVTGAAKLQATLATVRSETGATNAQMEKFRDLAFEIGNRVGVAPTEAAEMLRTITRLTAGQMSIANMQKIAPTIADYAATVHFNRPDVSVEQATGAGIALSHLFQAYKPEQLTALLDKAYRLSGIMREGPDQANRQMSYYEPLFKGVGVSDQESIGMMALLDRAGFRNKAGTGVRAALLEMMGKLQLTGHAQAAKAALLGSGQYQVGNQLLTGMGLYDKNHKATFLDKNGGVDFLGAMKKISDWVQYSERNGMDKMKVQSVLYSVFGMQGGNIAALMANPVMVDNLAKITAYQNDPRVSLAQGKKNRDNTLAFQFGRAVSNFQAVMIELGTPWLNDLRDLFRGIADHLHEFQAFLHQHREVEKAFGAVGALLTTIAGMVAGLGTLGLLGKVVQLAELFGSNGALGVILGGLVRTLFRFIPVVGWAVTALEGLNMMMYVVKNSPMIVTAIHNWWVKNEGLIGYTITWVFAAIDKMLLDAIGSMFNNVSSMIQTTAQNLYLLATPGGQVELQSIIAANMALAQSQWDKSHHESFNEGGSRAWNDVFGAGGMQFHPTINVTVNADGLSRADAQHIGDVSANTVQSILGKSGLLRTSPGLPTARAATVGSLLFNQ